MPSRPWCQSRMCSIDLETTGVEVETARLVTGCVAYVGGGLDTETVQVLADPGVEIPEAATAVHGVSTERARAEGLPAPAAVAIVLEAIAGRPEGSPVVAMNARFDLSVLHHEALRHGLTPLSDRAQLLYVVDVRVIDLWLDKFRAGKRTLVDLAREYGTKFDGAHDATADAIAAARVAYWIGNEVDVFRRGRGRAEVRELLALRKEWDRVRWDLPALHDAQQRWAAEQAADLERYFTAKGEPQPVAREWPVAA